jgi:hypothetical protein
MWSWFYFRAGFLYGAIAGGLVGLITLPVLVFVLRLAPGQALAVVVGGVLGAGLFSGIAQGGRGGMHPPPAPPELIATLAREHRRFERGRLRADNWERQRDSVRWSLLGPAAMFSRPQLHATVRYWHEHRDDYPAAFRPVMDELIDQQMGDFLAFWQERGGENADWLQRATIEELRMNRGEFAERHQGAIDALIARSDAGWTRRPVPQPASPPPGPGERAGGAAENTGDGAHPATGGRYADAWPMVIAIHHARDTTAAGTPRVLAHVYTNGVSGEVVVHEPLHTRSLTELFTWERAPTTGGGMSPDGMHYLLAARVYKPWRPETIAYLIAEELPKQSLAAVFLKGDVLDEMPDAEAGRLDEWPQPS